MKKNKNAVKLEILLIIVVFCVLFILSFISNDITKQIDENTEIILTVPDTGVASTTPCEFKAQSNGKFGIDILDKQKPDIRAHAYPEPCIYKKSEVKSVSCYLELEPGKYYIYINPYFDQDSGNSVDLEIKVYLLRPLVNLTIMICIIAILILLYYNHIYKKNKSGNE